MSNKRRYTDKTLLQIIHGIDFQLLKAQKTIMVEMSGLKKLPDAQRATIEGMLNFIDQIQDYAVDKFNLDKNKVFNFTDEKGIPNMTYSEAKRIVLKENE
jgi:hypothetical protein